MARPRLSGINALHISLLALRVAAWPQGATSAVPGLVPRKSLEPPKAYAFCVTDGQPGGPSDIEMHTICEEIGCKCQPLTATTASLLCDNPSNQTLWDLYHHECYDTCACVVPEDQSTWDDGESKDNSESEDNGWFEDVGRMSYEASQSGSDSRQSLTSLLGTLGGFGGAANPPPNTCSNSADNICSLGKVPVRPPAGQSAPSAPASSPSALMAGARARWRCGHRRCKSNNDCPSHGARGGCTTCQPSVHAGIGAVLGTLGMCASLPLKRDLVMPRCLCNTSYVHEQCCFAPDGIVPLPTSLDWSADVWDWAENSDDLTLDDLRRA